MSGGGFHVAPDAAAEMQVVLHVAGDFFTETLPSIGWIAAIALVGLTGLGLFLLVWMCVLRRCAGSCFTQLSAYVLALVGTLAILAIAFGSADIGMTALFGGAAFVAGAFVVAAATYVNDFIAGIQLLAIHLLDRHRLIVVDRFRGHLRAVGVFTSELVLAPNAATDARATGDAKGTVAETVLIPNRFVLGAPLLTSWSAEYRRSVKPGSLGSGHSHESGASSSTSTSTTRRTAADTYDVEAAAATPAGGDDDDSLWSTRPTSYDEVLSSTASRHQQARDFIERAGLTQRFSAVVAAAAATHTDSSSSSPSSSSLSRLVLPL
jgi:hypothetical protein